MPCSHLWLWHSWPEHAYVLGRLLCLLWSGHSESPCRGGLGMKEGASQDVLDVLTMVGIGGVTVGNRGMVDVTKVALKGGYLKQRKGMERGEGTDLPPHSHMCH